MVVKSEPAESALHLEDSRMRFNQLMMFEIAMKVMVHRFDNRHRVSVVSSMRELECGKQMKTLSDIVFESLTVYARRQLVRTSSSTGEL